MDEEHPQDDLYEIPLQVAVHKQAVVILGPNGAHLAMTADAADRSAALLTSAAKEARSAECA